MTVVFAGGGTGGHVYPAIAIADALRARAARVSFIGTADRLEARIVPQAGYDLHTIAARALPRAPSIALLATIASNLAGTFQSLRLLARERPDLVVATGGYVSFPVALAARIRRLLRRSHAALVLLEPNSAPGLTNRLLAPIVDEIWGASDLLGPRLRGKYEATGIPIRSSLHRLPARAAAVERLGLDPALRTLVAMGGSQGARSINDALVELIATGGWPAGWQLLHLTGAAEYNRVIAAMQRTPFRPKYVLRAYLDDMADAYAAGDLLLTRAGASTLAELAALGKPAILVPYPFASEGHQRLNTQRFESAGAAVVVTDGDLDAGTLRGLLERMLEPGMLEALTAGARSLRSRDPVGAILARIDCLTARTGKTKP